MIVASATNRQKTMPGIFSIFNLLSIFYIFRGLQLVVNIVRGWSSLVQEPFSSRKRQLAEQASFFVAVPPSVALHELFHALLVWIFGGTVIDFGYGVFWGYVSYNESFNAVQNWAIAVAGTVGNLVFGLILWALLRRHQSSTIRYFGVRALRFQVYFALLYYPILSLFLPAGSGADWQAIYEFGLTPVASGVTAVIHAALLLWFWQLDRRGWFEKPVFATLEAQQQFVALRAAAAHNPQDGAQQVQVVSQLRQGGAIRQAAHMAEEFRKKQRHSADMTLQLAMLRSQNQRNLSTAVRQLAEEALQQGLDSPYKIATAHQLLGQYHLERSQSEPALHHLTQAIVALQTLNSASTAAADATHQQRLLANLYFLRSRVYRQNKHYDLSYADGQKAVELAQSAQDENGVNYYREQLKILAHHAGRSFSVE
jgi:hypothetical protein